MISVNYRNGTRFFRGILFLVILTSMSLIGNVSSQAVILPLNLIQNVQYNPFGDLLAVSGGVLNGNVYDPYLEIFENDGDGTSFLSLTPNTSLPSGPLVNVSWSPDGSRLAGNIGDGLNSSIYIWNMNENDPNFQLGELITNTPQDNDTGSSVDLAWSPNGNFLASKEVFGLRIWDASNNAFTLVDSLSIPGFDIDWNPNGEELSLTGDGGVLRIPISVSGDILYTSASDHYVRSNETDQFPAISASWNNDGSRIAFSTAIPGSNQEILIFDTTVNPEIEVKRILDVGDVTSLTWSPDDQWLAGYRPTGEIIIIDADIGVINLIQPIDDYPGLLTIDWNPLTGEVTFGQSDGTLGTMMPNS